MSPALCTDLLGCLVQFQQAIATVVAATLGFGGVMLTLRYNARKARDLENYKRKRQRDVLVHSLIGELAVIREDFQDEVRQLKEVNAGKRFEIGGDLDRLTLVYENGVRELGLLPHEAVVRVVRSYTWVVHFVARYKKSETRMVIDGETLRAAIQELNDLTTNIEETINALRAVLNSD